MKKSRYIFFLGAVALVLALAFGWTAGVHTERAGSLSGRGVGAPSALPQVPQARQVDAAFVSIADRLAPAVVRITTRQAASSPAAARGTRMNPFEGTPFERFFDDFGREAPESLAPRMGMGSGVVIDRQGHILTNNHVVAQSDQLRVTFVDGKELSASVVGTDPKTDLAVVKVDGAPSIAPAEFGDSNDMRVGQWVMAIGNPFGLDHSVTVGVLSAKGRYGLAPTEYEDFLQTDASINPGNSGGPLVNLSGQVIGINTLIAGLGTGVGFAVSEAIAKPISQQLIEHGKVSRPYIGLLMQTMTADLTRAMGSNAPEHGALVAEVKTGTPAEQAGLRAGDVIERVNGKTVDDSRDVQQVVLGQKVGDSVTLSVWRDGKLMDVKLRTIELPAESASAGTRNTPSTLGLTVQTLTPVLANRFGIDPSTHGVVITSVQPGTSAANAGLRPGDLILSVDRTPVAAADEATRQLSASRDAGHLLQVRRGETTIFVALPGASGGR